MNIRPDPATTLPATLRSLREIVEEYDAKAEAIPQLIADFGAAVTALEMGACVGGTYAGQVFSGGAPYERTLRANLLQSAWQHVYRGLNLHLIAPASDRSKFEMAFKDPAPFTLGNIRATFGHYVADPRGHILRGLAEVFGHLDPAFKSHDRMKIGVKGLPKRIILHSVKGWNSWGQERLKDAINALRVYNGQPHIGWPEFRAFAEGGDDGELRELLERIGEGDDAATRPTGLSMRRFGNGNGHLFFAPEALRQVNEALAEYYGEVLPDCPEARPAKPAKGTAVSKDLQFYRTPAAVADKLVDAAYPRDGYRALEPSCGDGAILEALRRYASKHRISIRATGIEVDAGRAAAAEAKGFAVHRRNFLEVAPTPDFDLVLMNPPFYGKHYQQHVEHARKFLKPGGRLLAILPVTAVTDHSFVKAERYGHDRWEDLPVGSFSESGTNINTGIAKFGAAMSEGSGR